MRREGAAPAEPDCCACFDTLAFGELLSMSDNLFLLFENATKSPLILSSPGAQRRGVSKDAQWFG
jgi:hypothetical protein